MKDDSRDWPPGGGSGMYYILDAQHQVHPAALLEWAQWLEAQRVEPGGGLARVADTLLPGRFRVSTIFMGLDHRFGVGPPLLFETMAFYPTGRCWRDQWFTLLGRRQRLRRRGQRLTRELLQQRWTSWDAAAAGHARAVQAVRRFRLALQAAHAAGDEPRKERLHERVDTDLQTRT